MTRFFASLPPAPDPWPAGWCRCSDVDCGRTHPASVCGGCGAPLGIAEANAHRCPRRETIADRSPAAVGSRMLTALRALDGLPPRDPAEPVAGWRELGAYLAGRAPRPFPEPGELRRCPTCHGWHR